MPDLRPNIVVVEDDDDMNHAIERLLKAGGFRAATFESAESLLEKGAATSADCLVLDIQLPGLSGFQLCRRLQQDETRPRSFSLLHMMTSPPESKPKHPEPSHISSNPFLARLS